MELMAGSNCHSFLKQWKIRLQPDSNVAETKLTSSSYPNIYIRISRQSGGVRPYSKGSREPGRGRVGLSRVCTERCAETSREVNVRQRHRG